MTSQLVSLNPPKGLLGGFGGLGCFDGSNFRDRLEHDLLGALEPVKAVLCIREGVGRVGGKVGVVKKISNIKNLKTRAIC